MTIYIAHLYYDLMNLYGEIGNIKAIKYLLEEQNIKVKIDSLTIAEDIDFNKYDLIYIGSGTENNRNMVLNNLLKYKNEIKDYIESNKFIIATGNSIELLGKSIDNIKALNIFNYISKSVNQRIVGDVIISFNEVKNNIIGFQNRGSIIENNNYPLFEDASLGVNYKNFYGTYILGPLFIRNPEFAKYIINKVIKSKNKNFKLKKYDLKLEKKAYKNYLETYYK